MDLAVFLNVLFLRSGHLISSVLFNTVEIPVNGYKSLSFVMWRKHNAHKSTDGLHIGASKDLDAISFFSGLIDDVRIYNRIVGP